MPVAVNFKRKSYTDAGAGQLFLENTNKVLNA
jgi:hypothetical protein